MSQKHSNLREIHRPENWTVLDATERLTLTVVAADVHKIAYQTSDNTYWRLTNHSPPTWIQTMGTPGVDAAPIDVVAAEDLPAFTVVTVDGHVADSSNFAHIGRVVGLTLADIATGFSGSVKMEGEMTNPAWSFTPNSKLFLGSGGGLSSIAPATGFAQVIAVAQSDQTIIIQIGDPILL